VNVIGRRYHLSETFYVIKYVLNVNIQQSFLALILELYKSNLYMWHRFEETFYCISVVHWDVYVTECLLPFEQYACIAEYSTDVKQLKQVSVETWEQKGSGIRTYREQYGSILNFITFQKNVFTLKFSQFLISPISNIDPCDSNELVNKFCTNYHGLWGSNKLLCKRCGFSMGVLGEVKFRPQQLPHFSPDLSETRK